ncbi:MAG TPA: DUF262 domain-containing protein [Paludibacteraceae bacterium]|nr:DUF262 domain-containing protein [Paludibacteraceae bacterium]HOO24365.1 DUF262 domain-containing protein [Paludibacteraceae bacterium]HOS37906.1 DUF262 domain-containing protein [Paludibacteraceae bacterium]HPD28013.1 DUF262 domain-containing protein [Paludibacteraceae bacterium]HPK20946.1 DUF262 domain-containing protein [Paludibacteraceae bacterium]
MSKLNVDQKTIKELFENKKSDFLIPDYQRPYAWEENECQTLWDDIFVFAFPDNDYSKFDSKNDEYFLGPIVTFLNERGKQEIIDGQQRLTTLMLLLRAFYAKFGNMQDENSKTTRTNIEKCIWKTDEFGNPNKNALKIDSEVASDNDKEEFLAILKTGDATNKKSRYAINFAFFQKKIDEFLVTYPSYFSYLPTRILNNCILLPIEAESQDTALRIFSTLNDRGLPLSDADIFKAQFYKFFSSIGKKDEFVKEWKNLEELCEKIFHPITGTPMDELFTRYMYYERALQGIKSSTTEALRKFYEKDKYILLKKEKTFNNLIILANFWNDVSNQNKEKFSDKVLKKLFVLNYAPNGMWNYFVSVYFMKNKDENDCLDDQKFYLFLTKITAFIWAYAITNPGVNALRTPIYYEMINVVNGKDVEFANFKFDETDLKTRFNVFEFSNIRPITKSMLVWWAFNNSNQQLLTIDTVYEIEHIFAKKRQENENSLKNPKNLEVLGNKSFLEKRINIRASDYKFSDKIKYYKGFQNSKNQIIEGTKIQELIDMLDRSDFNETDIENRNKNIIDSFVEYLKESDLIIE